MEENNNMNGSGSTQYIRSGKMGNTVDNTQRHSKEEDALNPPYTNPPLGEKEQQSTPTNEKGSAEKEERIPSTE